MASVNYKVPPVFTAQKPYSRWIDEIKAWKALTDLDKKKMGVAIALSLPEEGLSSIRDKVFSDLSLDELNSDDGVDKLIEFMDKIFKKDELSEAYESYTEFDRFRRSKVGSMEDYVMEFEKLYNKTKKFNMELPQAVLAFKLLEYSELEMKDRQLVLTGVNYTDVGSLFKQMTTSLKKFFGQQANRDMEDGIKVESACMANEDVNYSRNRFGRPRGGGFRGHQFSNRANDHKPQGNFNYKPKYNKSVNPNGPDGLPLRCLSCDSIRHLAVLFTGNKSHEALVLLTESANSAVLDSACTSTVAGETWMKCYLDSLDPSIREKIVETPSDTLFKFGGGTVLQSAKKVKIPCAIAGVECEILADVVTSDIPLLLSKDSMKKAKMKLDLENDSASIFGKDVDLQCTSSGHYCIPIDQVKVDVNITASALISTQMTKDKTEVIEKLHKQFAHPSAKRLKTLLKDAGGYTEEHLNCVDHVTEGCDVCKRYKKTPARPVVSLPLATEYNEVVAIDLKIWKPNIYFLHMVDIATRFSLATVIRKKTPEVIADKIMALWIGSGMGPPKRFLADNGGEFANEIFRDMCANLNIEVINTAAYSPWQNGICERNHAVVDDCVAKILEDQPKLNLEIALVWAVNAKNSLSMVYGWSPYQLVFGANPNLPSVLVDKPPALEYNTVSQTFANHLNALHSGRRAFIQAESSERIRRALRHKIRASGVCYQHGDRVYYKRDDDNRWKGPGTVLGQDGKVVFVRHGSIYVRVHPCRLIRCGTEFSEGKSTQQADSQQLRSTITQTEIINSDDAEEKNNRGDQQNREDQVPLQNDDEYQQYIQPPKIENDENEHQDHAPEGVVDNSGQIVSQRNQQANNIPHVGDEIVYRTKENDTWVKAKVMSRGGKSTGKNRAYLNVQDENKDAQYGIDFATDVQDWCKAEHLDEANAVVVPQSRHKEVNVKQAKQLELDNWKLFRVYDEVQYTGQKLMSTRWVITEKETIGERKVKARLVVRGFEEENEVKSDSPTVHKESLRLFLALASTSEFNIHSIDIKAAFLQGQEIDRVILIQPPKECSSDKPIAWKLNKCVYGLTDASRNWFLSVKKVLLQLECIQSKIDPAIFYWHFNDHLEGMFLMHVDDFLWAGSELFKNQVICHLRKKFDCGKELDSSFRYIGLNIEHEDKDIYMQQHDYTDELKQVDIADVKNGIYPEIVGQLHWIATQSRPDLCFDVLDLSTLGELSETKLQSKLNKVIRKAKNNLYRIKYPSLGSLENIELILYADASYANLSDRVSSAGGYVIFLRGQNGNMCPISWSAKKIRRVVKSTLAAEALSLVEGLDACYFVRSILQEMIQIKKGHSIMIKCFTDNKSLCQNIHSTKLISEKRLCLDLASIKESVSQGDITVTWIKTSSQISDCLTKAGADFHPLIKVLNTGKGP
ncbi:Retrovirus-related Pol polyprotein from transposon RE2 [Nymphon striatum]|nr:Retrovirus-related Pol polyprotein from transposon RE2 [Nymphon striatum]